MAQIETPDIFGQFLRGQQAGEQQRTKRTLAEFLQPALGGDQSALSQVYAADPNAGMQVQGMVQKQAATDRETKVSRWQQAARLYPNAPESIKPQLYGQIVELTEELGVAPRGSLPRQHDPALDEGFNKFLAGISGQEQGYTLSAGAKRFDNNNQLVAEAPFAPQAPRYFEGDDGVYMATPQGLRQLPSDMSQAVAAPSGNYQDVYADIAARHGSAVTSGVRPVLPGVGAGANSQHPKGTAADFRTNGLRPEQVQALMGDLRGQGFEVIDERDNRNGRGPHIHAELPPGGRGTYRPKGSAAQAARDARADEALRLSREAAERANRAEQRQIQAQAVTGKPPTEDERKAAGWVNQARFAFQNMQNALAKDPNADSPGFGETYSGFFAPERAEPEIANRMRSPTRQQYVQAASSFAEAALRAATGAGVNENEARQKIAELTPQRGDSREVRDQKFDALSVYLDSLEQRAGRALQTGKPSKGGPVAGQIIDGYRFRGGDPNDQSNWEQL